MRCYADATVSVRAARRRRFQLWTVFGPKQLSAGASCLGALWAGSIPFTQLSIVSSASQTHVPTRLAKGSMRLNSAHSSRDLAVFRWPEVRAARKVCLFVRLGADRFGLPERVHLFGLSPTSSASGGCCGGKTAVRFGSTAEFGARPIAWQDSS